MSMLELIKKAGAGAVEASNPMQLLFGEVASAQPLSVRVDQRFTLPANFLIVPESLTELKADLRHDHSFVAGGTGGKTDEALQSPIVLRRGLESGDRVILLRMQGGQRFLILDRVVSGP